MTGLRFLLPLAACALIGMLWLSPIGSRRLGPLAPGLAGLVGAVVLTLEMLALSWLGIRWSPVSIFGPLLLAGLAATRWPRREGAPTGMRFRASAVPGLLAATLALLAFAWVVATGRATSADYLLFWGPKGARFAWHQGIDLAFLKNPANILLHPDYPPLVAFLYAAGGLVAGRFAWGAALLEAPLFLGFGVWVFWACARDGGQRRAAELAAVVAALLGFGLSVSLSAGNAEAFLISFELAALAALSFSAPSLEMDLLVSILLGGMVLTKIEGLVLAGLLVAVYGWGPQWRSRLVRLGAVPLLVAAVWLAYCKSRGLLFVYLGGESGSFTLRHARVIASGLWRSASFQAVYLPWMLLAVLFATGERRRIAVRPMLVGLGFLAFVFYVFSHGDNPQLWIRWSADRLLLTPLLCAFISVAAGQQTLPADVGAFGPGPRLSRRAPSPG